VAKDDEACAAVIRLLSHDLRNPLTAVQLNAQLIERAAAGAGREQEQRWAALITGAARRMDTMIQQLVEAERLRMGQVKLAPLPIVLAEMLHEVQALSSAACAPHPIRLALPETPVTISVDRPRLGRALTNLLRLTAQVADDTAEVTVQAAAREGGVACTIHAPRPAALGARPADADLGIAFHTARILIECHGGSLRALTDAPEPVGFALVLPATSART
jgi:K+-sensing histidine kinase KdpD